MQNVSDLFKTKINGDTRYFSVKCDIYFDGDNQPPITFEGTDDIVSISLLEEACAESDSPLGALSSNELTITLNNKGHRFTSTNTISPYYSKLIPNVKVKAYLGLEIEPDVFEYVNLGTYKSQDWDTTSSDVEVSTVCHDRLYDLGLLDCPSIPVIQNTTIYNMFVYLFRSLGLSETEYEIDTSLNYPLQYSWFVKGKVKENLQKLAEGGSCLVYVLRNNDKIRVRNIFSGYTRVGYLDDSTQINRASIPQRYTKTYNKVGVTKKTPFVRNTEQILQLDNILVEPGISTLSKAEFSTGPIAIMNQIQCSNGIFTKVKSFTHTAWNTTITFENSGPIAETVSVIGYGQKIECVDTEASVQSATTFTGERQLTIDNMFIQDTNTARDYAARILQFVSDPGAYVEIDYRGNPAIELWDVLFIDDTSDKVSGFEVVPLRNTLNFDGSLSAQMTCLRQTTKALNDWVYVGMGLYIYVPRMI